MRNGMHYIDSVWPVNTDNTFGLHIVVLENWNIPTGIKTRVAYYDFLKARENV